MVLRIPFSFAMLPPAAALVLLGAAAQLAALSQAPAIEPGPGQTDSSDPGALGVLTMKLDPDGVVPCNPATRACFDVRLELFVAEPRLYDLYVDPRARRRVAVLRRYLYDQLGLPYLPLSCDPLESGDVFEADSASYVLLPLVSLREAVRSGLDRPRLPRFETDPLNLIPATRLLASVRAGADLGLYVPDRNPCWTAWAHLHGQARVAVDGRFGRVGGPAGRL